MRLSETISCLPTCHPRRVRRRESDGHAGSVGGDPAGDCHRRSVCNRSGAGGHEYCYGTRCAAISLVYRRRWHRPPRCGRSDGARHTGTDETRSGCVQLPRCRAHASAQPRPKRQDRTSRGHPVGRAAADDRHGRRRLDASQCPHREGRWLHAPRLRSLQAGWQRRARAAYAPLGAGWTIIVAFGGVRDDLYAASLGGGEQHVNLGMVQSLYRIPVRDDAAAAYGIAVSGATRVTLSCDEHCRRA